MKTIAHFLTILLLTVSFQLPAQEFIGSHVRLTKEAVNQPVSVKDDNGIIRLNDQTNEFSIYVQLWQILTSANESDSIADINKHLRVNFRGQFPISDFAFYTGDEKTYQIPGKLTINHISRAISIVCSFHKSISENFDENDVHSYPVRISFAIEINPADYNLDIETAKFTETIIVAVENGIINKSIDDSFIDEGDIK
jgi:hypothetical protein